MKRRRDRGQLREEARIEDRGSMRNETRWRTPQRASEGKEKHKEETREQIKRPNGHIRKDDGGKRAVEVKKETYVIRQSPARLSAAREHAAARARVKR